MNGQEAMNCLTASTNLIFSEFDHGLNWKVEEIAPHGNRNHLFDYKEFKGIYYHIITHNVQVE